jgi:hypothetical protein
LVVAGLFAGVLGAVSPVTVCAALAFGIETHSSVSAHRALTVIRRTPFKPRTMPPQENRHSMQKPGRTLAL